MKIVFGHDDYCYCRRLVQRTVWAKFNPIIVREVEATRARSVARETEKQIPNNTVCRLSESILLRKCFFFSRFLFHSHVFARTKLGFNKFTSRPWKFHEKCSTSNRPKKMKRFCVFFWKLLIPGAIDCENIHFYWADGPKIKRTLLIIIVYRWHRENICRHALY